MPNKRGRLKTALRRVFKVRGNRVNSKHHALVDSPGANTVESKGAETTTLTAVPSSHSIPNLDPTPAVTADSKHDPKTSSKPDPNLDHFISRHKSRGGPVDVDEVSIFSGFSIKTEALIKTQHVRRESIQDSQTFAGTSQFPTSPIIDDSQTPLPLREISQAPPPSRPSSHFPPSSPCSVPCNNEITASNIASKEIPKACLDDGTYNEDSAKQIDERIRESSPTGVTELFPLIGRVSTPIIDTLHSDKVPDQSKSRSRSNSGETATTGHSKCVIPKHSHDAEKANEAFLALKKELEKNEFTKAAQVIKHVQSNEGTILTTPPSRDSAEKPKKLPNQQHHDTYEILPTAPSTESNAAPNPPEAAVIDSILGITPALSVSDSLDSLGSYDSYYSSFDMDSIGDITIDSTTTRLIEMHKRYCDSAKVNLNHPARKKKSNMRVSSAYSVDKKASDSTASIKTDRIRRLTW